MEVTYIKYGFEGYHHTLTVPNENIDRSLSGWRMEDLGMTDKELVQDTLMDLCNTEIKRAEDDLRYLEKEVESSRRMISVWTNHKETFKTNTQ